MKIYKLTIAMTDKTEEGLLEKFSKINVNGQEAIVQILSELFAGHGADVEVTTGTSKSLDDLFHSVFGEAK